MTLTPYPRSSEICPPYPLDDDSVDQRLYGEQLKLGSKQYRGLLESMLRELDSRGNIQYFAVTFLVLPQRKGGNFTLSALDGDNQPLVEGSSFRHYVGELLRCLAKIDLLECIFLTQEFHSDGELKGLPHYHVFLAVRSLFGTGGSYIQAALQGLFALDFNDFQLRRLDTFMDRKKYLNYMVKEEKQYYHALYVFSSTTVENRDSYYGQLLSNYEWGCFAVLRDYLSFPTEGYFDPRCLDARGEPAYLPYGYLRALESQHELHKRHYLINPPPTETITVDCLVYYLTLYCQFSGYFLSRGSLYRRREGTRYARELVSTLDDLLENPAPLYQFLAKEFPFQFTHAQNYVRLAFSRHLPDLMVRFRNSTSR